MPSNFTANYDLSQWEKSDKVQMEDFNADNAKIDEALKAGADARAAMQTLLNKKGNCSISLSTYTGTGTNTTVINFPKRPSAFIAVGFGGLLFGWGSQNVAYIVTGAAGSVVWNGNQFKMTTSWGASTQLNDNTAIYHVIAFYAES